MASTPAQNPSRSSDVAHSLGDGPRHGGPGQRRAGRTSENRAQMGGPSNGSTTAHVPRPLQRPEVVGHVGETGQQPAFHHGERRYLLHGRRIGAHPAQALTTAVVIL